MFFPLNIQLSYVLAIHFGIINVLHKFFTFIIRVTPFNLLYMEGEWCLSWCNPWCLKVEFEFSTSIHHGLHHDLHHSTSIRRWNGSLCKIVKQKVQFDLHLHHAWKSNGESHVVSHSVWRLNSTSYFTQLIIRPPFTPSVTPWVTPQRLTSQIRPYDRSTSIYTSGDSLRWPYHTSESKKISSQIFSPS